MKNFLNRLASPKLTLILLIISAFVLAIATFVENSYDTAAAKELVYNAKWFEFVLLLIFLNLIASIIYFKLYKIERLGGFLFHIGFLVMIIGAAATRYIGYEGTMHIREGQASSVIYTDEAYFMVSSPEDNYDFNLHVTNDLLADLPFSFSFESKQKGTVKVTLQKYVSNAKEQILENQSDGTDMIKIRYAVGHDVHSAFIKDGEIYSAGRYKIAYNNFSDTTAVNITGNKKQLKISSRDTLFVTSGTGVVLDTVSPGKADISLNIIYQTGDFIFMLTEAYTKAKSVYVPGNPEEQSADVILTDVEFGGKKHEIRVFGGKGYFTNFRDYNIDGLNMKFAFGSKQIELPFSLFLDDFILERYPGSMSPSSYESRVTLIDKENNVNEKHRIYMNHVLDYRGYRFFQSSYDKDEKGTILSVNHDRLGTYITYFSYILLVVGFIIIFFSKKSRFTALRKEVANSGKGKKVITSVIILMTVFGNTAFSQNIVDKQHSENFGRLIVQKFDGRFEPVYTLATDVVHKISKKNKIKIEGVGTFNPMQVFMGIMTEPEFWGNQKIIYIKDKSLRDVLGIKGKHASYNDFFNDMQRYKLLEYSDNAYRKDLSERTAFDKELINVEERLNIYLMTVRGSILKIFPEPDSENHKWVSPDDSLSYRPLTGSLQAINEDLNLGVLNYRNIYYSYIQSLKDAAVSGDYTRADRIIGYIKNIQRQIDVHEDLPSETKINTEVFYTKANIFTSLAYAYMILSLILIILSFLVHFKENPGKILQYSLNFFIGLLALSFVFHTLGLILRWYLSGHAPWSNGYETLVFVAWAGILAGFVFMKYSKITLAATALLAFFVMLTASFSNYDPQITTLQPVLNSYWLIIHVAVMVMSYGFLGLGFVLGLLNLIMYASKNKTNHIRLSKTINELTNINEMNLIIGIILATVGTFLGAVWANESWGKYWGWDAKETWALIIVIVYALVLHLRLVPGLKGKLLFNISSVFAFGTVIMTFVGVNFYFTKGLHSYAQGGAVVFPLWAWMLIAFIVVLSIAASIKQKIYKEEDIT